MNPTSNKLINYCSGGLGNILLPLSSCIFLSKKTDRELIICNEPTFRCQIEISDLFNENFKCINKNELENFQPLKIYGNREDISFDKSLYSNGVLDKLSSSHGCTPINNLNLNDDSKNILIYHNDFIPQVNIEDSISELRKLKINDSIKEMSETFVHENRISNETIGVHARGTDFNSSLEIYLKQIENVISETPNCKIFFCSDEDSWEKVVSDKFPNNLIVRRKKSNLTRYNPNNPNWSNNVLTDKNSVIDGFVDLIILSKCNLKIYNQHSSFSKLAKLL